MVLSCTNCKDVYIAHICLVLWKANEHHHQESSRRQCLTVQSLEPLPEFNAQNQDIVCCFFFAILGKLLNLSIFSTVRRNILMVKALNRLGWHLGRAFNWTKCLVYVCENWKCVPKMPDKHKLKWKDRGSEGMGKELYQISELYYERNNVYSYWIKSWQLKTYLLNFLENCTANRTTSWDHKKLYLKITTVSSF